MSLLLKPFMVDIDMYDVLLTLLYIFLNSKRPPIIFNLEKIEIFCLITSSSVIPRFIHYHIIGV